MALACQRDSVRGDSVLRFCLTVMNDPKGGIAGWKVRVWVRSWSQAISATGMRRHLLVRWVEATPVQIHLHRLEIKLAI